MADFWCRHCWRQIGTKEMYRAFVAELDGDVPRDGHWPIHCWAKKNGTRCIMPPPSSHVEWLLTLAHNLAIAAGYCASFELGRDYQIGIERAITRLDLETARRDEWHPGCRRSAP